MTQIFIPFIYISAIKIVAWQCYLTQWSSVVARKGSNFSFSLFPQESIYFPVWTRAWRKSIYTLLWIHIFSHRFWFTTLGSKEWYTTILEFTNLINAAYGRCLSTFSSLFADQIKYWFYIIRYYWLKYWFLILPFKYKLLW